MKRSRTSLRPQFESLETRQLLASSITNIMPLGDSITEAFAGHNSYRYWLYNDLAQAGYNVNFIGSQTGVNGGDPEFNNFDENHEGHVGWTADQIAANIKAWATTNQPQIVLLHIGTNDIIQNQTNASTQTDISNIITNLRSVVPNVKILLAQIIPSTQDPTMFPDLNSRIATLATTLTTAQSPITLVDQYDGFPTADLYDGIHPNDAGEQIIATQWFNALKTILPAPTTPPPGSYLSDMNYTVNSNGWGPPENDRSNGETGNNDGHTLTLNGTTYMRGIGVHAPSDLSFNIAGKGFTEFDSDIGVDDEVGNSGSVVFQVYADGVLKYTSPTLTGTSSTLSISVPIPANSSTLRLVVTDSGDGNGFDHADWANARLFAGVVIPPPTAPSGLGATFNTTTNGVDLSWLDNSSDETGFRIERKTGINGTYAQIADLAANTKTFSDTSSLATGTTYYYRVYAYKTGAANSGYSNEQPVTIPVPAGTTYLSDLPYTVKSNGWGPPENDRSNGEQGAHDGNTITLNGVTYTKGIGVHATSDLVFNLNGQYTQFISDIGVDDEVGNNGTVAFEVFLNGSTTAAYNSGTMTGASATKTVTLNVTGVNTMELMVIPSTGGDFDHADWAGARLIAGTPVTPPNAPSGLNAVYNSTTGKVDLNWADNSSDEIGFRVERKTGAGGTYAQIADLVAGTMTYTDTSTLSPGATYYYHVYAYKVGAVSGFSNEQPVTIPVPTGTTTYLSDLPYTVKANGWGAPENDRSNGEQGAHDGNTITLNGVTYTKGIGVHAQSDLVFNLNGQYTTFLSDIGIDDEVGNNGTVDFQVFLNGSSTAAYDSGTMTGASATKTISLNVAGVTTMELVVKPAPGVDFDHADWANARLTT